VKRVLRILKKLRPQEDFENCDDFILNGLLDSFDLVSLVGELETAFTCTIEGTDITPENIKNLDTIRDLLERCNVSGLEDVAAGS
jgi:acyl carrier protein